MKSNSKGLDNSVIANSAALDSDSELAIFLNQDAEIKSLDLTALESLFSSNDVAMAGGRIYSSNGQHIDSIGKEASLLSFFSSWALLPLRKLGLNLGNRLVNGEEKYFKTQEVPWNYGPLIVVKTSVFRENRGFDRRFFMYVEEVELSRRIRKRGFRVMYEPTLQTVHESPNMISGLSTNTVYHTLRGQRIFLSIHGSGISPFLFQLLVPTTCIVIGILSSILFFWSPREYNSSKALFVGGIKALLNPNFKLGYK